VDGQGVGEIETRSKKSKQQHRVDNSPRMQNIKNKEGESIKGTRGGLSRRERANSATVMELWAEKERKEEKEEKKRMRQKEEECDKIFKRSKLVERSPSKRVERENETGEWNEKIDNSIERFKERFKTGNNKIEERS